MEKQVKFLGLMLNIAENVNRITETNEVNPAVVITLKCSDLMVLCGAAMIASEALHNEDPDNTIKMLENISKIFEKCVDAQKMTLEESSDGE